MKTIPLGAMLRTNNQTKPRAIRSGIGAAFSNIGSLPVDKPAHAIAKFTAEVDGEFGVGSRKGDVWWEVKDAPVIGSDETKNGFMAEVHKGEKLMTVTLEEDTTKPPLPNDLSVRVVVDLYPEEKLVVVNSTHDLSDFKVQVGGDVFIKDTHG